MLIGELAELSHCSRDTIRYYEKQGLLRLPKTSRRANNYKEYSAHCVDDLKLIRSMAALGFTLHEISEFMATLSESPNRDCNLQEAVTQKLTAIDAQIAKLNNLKAILLQVQCQPGCEISSGSLGCAPSARP
jgi:DNA-binding transcriptional MerR regulator